MDLAFANLPHRNHNDEKPDMALSVIAGWHNEDLVKQILTNPPFEIEDQTWRTVFSRVISSQNTEDALWFLNIFEHCLTGAIVADVCYDFVTQTKMMLREVAPEIYQWCFKHLNPDSLTDNECLNILLSVQAMPVTYFSRVSVALSNISGRSSVEALVFLPKELDEVFVSYVVHHSSKENTQLALELLISNLLAGILSSYPTMPGQAGYQGRLKIMLKLLQHGATLNPQLVRMLNKASPQCLLALLVIGVTVEASETELAALSQEFVESTVKWHSITDVLLDIERIMRRNGPRPPLPPFLTDDQRLLVAHMLHSSPKLLQWHRMTRQSAANCCICLHSPGQDLFYQCITGVENEHTVCLQCAMRVESRNCPICRDRELLPCKKV